MGINIQILSLYQKYFPEFLETLKKASLTSKNKEIKNFSTPLLMYCWEEEYSKAEKKFFMLGKKQTVGVNLE